MDSGWGRVASEEEAGEGVVLVAAGDDRERSIFIGGNNFTVKLPRLGCCSPSKLNLVPSDSVLWAPSEAVNSEFGGEAGKQKGELETEGAGPCLEASSLAE